MDIIEKVIDMCEDAKVLEPQVPNFALAEVYKGNRIHVKFSEDREMFIVFTDNDRVLFANQTYLGGIMIDRHCLGYAVRPFFIHARAIVLSDDEHSNVITTIGDKWSDLMWNIGNHDRLSKMYVEYAYKHIPETSEDAFEKCWEEASKLRVEIKLNDRGDGFKF